MRIWSTVLDDNVLGRTSNASNRHRCVRCYISRVWTLKCKFNSSTSVHGFLKAGVLSWIIICLNSCTIKLYLKLRISSWIPFLYSLCIILFFLVQRNVNQYPGTFLKCIASEQLPHFISLFLFHGHEHPRYDDRYER